MADIGDQLARTMLLEEVQKLTAPPMADEPPQNIICLADVEREEVNWLMFPYVAIGKLTVIQGDPGAGKTFLSAYIASLVTRGGCHPLFPGVAFPTGNVLFQTGEDGLADTLRPRFESLGADLSKIYIIDESENPVSFKDLDRLTDALRRYRPKLLIFDPIQAYLGADVDFHRANEIRPVMKGLGNLAAQHGCAIVLIGHLNKSIGGKALYRGVGSIDIPAVARSVLLVGIDPDDKSQRVVLQTKSSLAAPGPALGFTLDPETGFQWTGKLEDMTEERLLGMGRRSGKTGSAESILADILADGPKPAKEAIQAVVDVVGCSARTVQNAAKALGINYAPVRDGKQLLHYNWQLGDSGEI